MWGNKYECVQDVAVHRETSVKTALSETLYLSLLQSVCPDTGFSLHEEDANCGNSLPSILNESQATSADISQTTVAKLPSTDTQDHFINPEAIRNNGRFTFT